MTFMLAKDKACISLQKHTRIIKINKIVVQLHSEDAT